MEMWKLLLALLLTGCSLSPGIANPDAPTLTAEQNACAVSRQGNTSDQNVGPIDLKAVDLDTLDASIVKALNGGASAQAIDAALHPYIGQAQAVDFENDGLSEVVVLAELYRALSETERYSSGAIVVYYCKAGTYKSVRISDKTFAVDLNIVAIESLFPDNTKQVVIRGRYAIGFCALAIWVIDKGPEGYNDIMPLEGYPEDCSAEVSIQGPNENGYKAMVISGEVLNQQQTAFEVVTATFNTGPGHVINRAAESSP